MAFLASLTSPHYKEIDNQEYARQLVNLKRAAPEGYVASILTQAVAAEAASILTVVGSVYLPRQCTH